MPASVLICFLLAALGSETADHGHYPGAVEVFHCTFDESWDKDYDGWPDHWSRQRGPGFPSFVHIGIRDEPAPNGARCLRIDLDGRAGAAYSPPVDVAPLWSYVLEGYLQTEGLRNDRAFFSVTLLDEGRQPLETVTSEKVRTTQGWQKVRLGPVACENRAVRYAVIGLHLEPQSDEDLKGSARFADVWLGRLPRISLQTNRTHNFFTDAGAVEITCAFFGLPETCPEVAFDLEDALGRQIARAQRQVETQPTQSTVDPARQQAVDATAAPSGTIAWKPPLPGPGFYRVRAEMRGGNIRLPPCQLSLVVVDAARAIGGSEFGWSLPRGDKPLPLPALAEVVGQAGIGWVKYPLWHDDADDKESVERLVAFCEQLGDRRIEVVGMLFAPPKKVREHYAPAQTLCAADIFTPPPSVWYPSLETVLTRPGISIRWWQLGRDKDTSFVGYPNLPAKIAAVKAELDRIGQDVNLGMGWTWSEAMPQAPGTTAPWRFLSLSADPPLASTELAAHLDASQKAKPLRWVVLEPLSRNSFSTAARATDLLEQMTAAKIHGADAIFCSDPFGTERGLLNDDGSPGELLLPWRTTALALGGAKHLGSIVLPGGSSNQIFARGGDAVMLVGNARPTEEVLYLGESVRQVDLWGHTATPETTDRGQTIQVGRLPTFVSGLSVPIARWRVDFKFAEERLPSILRRPRENSFRLKNPWPTAIDGQITLDMPESWKVEPRQIAFHLAGGEQRQQPFELILPDDAQSGRQLVRVDCDIQGKHPCHFSVYRQIDVGLGDVYIELKTQQNGRGELQISQRFVNAGDCRVNFRCQVYAPGRRRLQTDVVNLAPGSDVQTYRLPDAAQLVGKTLWLRAEEIDGPRVLNYRFSVKM